ncbi:MAG: hypothetical protein KDA05_12530 [Phycisphaerales bacterium]|nr:hypothetical protein [Phycisphaerales bacterium]
MSRGVLLANFVAMVLLSLVAAGLVLFPAQGPQPPAPLVAGLDPSSVTALRVERTTDTGARAVERVERTPTGVWDCVWTPGHSGSDDARWPVADVRVRSGLRMIADATLTTNAPTTIDASPATLEIATQGEQPTRLTFGAASAAGRAPVRVEAPDADARTGLTTDALHAVFARTGLLAWRDDRAMPGVARDASNLEITVSTGGQSLRLELARVQGRWGLLDPVAERAESQAVQSSIEALGRLRVLSFRDDAEAAALGLESPRVTLAVSGGRGPDAYQWRIDVGSPASADANQVFVRLTGQRGDGPADARTLGPVYGVLALDGLSGVFMNAEAYLARTTLATTTADIRRFVIRSADGQRAWRYERTIDGWTVQSSGAASPRPATSVEAQAIPVVLQTLAEQRATAVALTDQPAFEPIASLEIEGAAGLVAESVMIGRAPAPRTSGDPNQPSGQVLTTRSESASRFYGPMPEAFQALLPTLP